MKKLVCVALCVLLCACSADEVSSGNQKVEQSDSSSEAVLEVDKWSKEDFSFYDESGKEKIFMTANENMFSLSEYPELKSFRNVQIGDRATTAIAKYDVPYNLTVYGSGQDFYKLDKNTDLEKEIVNAALNKQEFNLTLIFDANLSVLDAYDYISGEKAIQDVWMFGLVVKDEKISDLMVARK